METDGRKTVAVVIPVFNEEASIPALCARLKAVMEGAGQYRWQWVFVDDGSRDGTVESLRAQIADGLPISVIRFSRNFGHQAAIKAGLDFVDADAVITMDGDGQHPPELIPTLLELWQAGNKVVQTVRAAVQEHVGGPRMKLSKWAYTIINWFAERPIPPECADFRLIDRQVLEQLKSLPETEPMLRGVVAWVGFQQATLEYQVQTRLNGESRYSIRQMVNLLLGGIFDLSRKPLAFAAAAAVVVAGAGLAGWLIGLIGGLVFWIFLLTAVELLGLGLVGAYLGRAYVETLDRPMYIVSEQVNFDDAADGW